MSSLCPRLTWAEARGCSTASWSVSRGRGRAPTVATIHLTTSPSHQVGLQMVKCEDKKLNDDLDGVKYKCKKVKYYVNV